MEIEKLPTIINEMQSGIDLLKKRLDSISGAKKAGEVRLLLRNESTYVANELEDKMYDLSEVDGIIIPLLDGREFLLYPKYEKRRMLEENRIKDWKAKGMTEIESLYAKCDGSKETDELLSIGSPAAEFVRGVTTHRQFNLPGDVLVAVAAIRHLDEINAIAKHIDGADKLENASDVWSCSRCGANGGWCASGNGGCASASRLSSAYLAVPLMLYKA